MMATELKKADTHGIWGRVDGLERGGEGRDSFVEYLSWPICLDSVVQDGVLVTE